MLSRCTPSSLSRARQLLSTVATGNETVQYSSGKILSIQSHVVSGYVGNRASTFPLNLLGLDVDVLNTTQLSNHSGYPKHPGHRLSATELCELIAGLQANGLCSAYTHLLTGYVGSPTVLESLASLLPSLRAANPTLQFFCDPVLGDNDQIYVQPESVEIYREHIVSQADFLKPNGFESQLLTGIRPDTVDQGLLVCDAFHKKGVRSALISSLTSCEKPDTVDILLSWDFATSRHLISVPRLPSYFSGTGDLLTALMLGWTKLHPDDVALAFENSVSTVFAVLLETLATGAPPSVVNSLVGPELRLIQSKKAIENPNRQFRARSL